MHTAHTHTTKNGKNAHTLKGLFGCCNETERTCACYYRWWAQMRAPRFDIQFFPPAGLLSAIWAFDFFFIYRNYYGIPKEFIRQNFFALDGGCIIKPLDDQQVCINMWWRAIDDNHANASRAHEKRFKSPLSADDIATSRQQTGKKNDRFRLNAELWINRTTKKYQPRLDT